MYGSRREPYTDCMALSEYLVMIKGIWAILYRFVFVVAGGWRFVDHWIRARKLNFLKAGLISRLLITFLSLALSSPCLWVWIKF